MQGLAGLRKVLVKLFVSVCERAFSFMEFRRTGGVDNERAEQKIRYEILCTRFCLFNYALYPNRLYWARFISKLDVEQFWSLFSEFVLLLFSLLQLQEYCLMHVSPTTGLISSYRGINPRTLHSPGFPVFSTSITIKHFTTTAGERFICRPQV